MWNDIKYGRKFWNDMYNMEENSEKIGKYRRKVGWIVKRYGKYGRKVSWNVKWYGKYGRKLWNDMENINERYFE